MNNNIPIKEHGSKSALKTSIERRNNNDNNSDNVVLGSTPRELMNLKLQSSMQRGLVRGYAIAKHMEEREGEKDHLQSQPTIQEPLPDLVQSTGKKAMLLAQRNMECKSKRIVLVALESDRPIISEELEDIARVCQAADAQLLIQHDVCLLPKVEDALYKGSMIGWEEEEDSHRIQVERYFGERISYLISSQGYLTGFLVVTTCCLLVCCGSYGYPVPSSTATSSHWWRLFPWATCWNVALLWYWCRVRKPWQPAFSLDKNYQSDKTISPAELEFYRLDQSVKEAILKRSNLSEREAAPLVDVTYYVPGPEELVRLVASTLATSIMGQWLCESWIDWLLPGLSIFGMPMRSVIATKINLGCLEWFLTWRSRSINEENLSQTDIKITTNQRGKVNAISVSLPNHQESRQIYVILAHNISPLLGFPLGLIMNFCVDGLDNMNQSYWRSTWFMLHMTLYFMCYSLVDVAYNYGSAWLSYHYPHRSWVMGWGTNGAQVFQGQVTRVKGLWNPRHMISYDKRSIKEEEKDDILIAIKAEIAHSIGQKIHSPNYNQCNDSHLQLAMLAAQSLTYGFMCPPLLLVATTVAIVMQLAERHKLCNLDRRPLPSKISGSEKAWAHFAVVAMAISIPFNIFVATSLGGWRGLLSVGGPSILTAYYMAIHWVQPVGQPVDSTISGHKPDRSRYETYRSRDGKRKSRIGSEVIQPIFNQLYADALLYTSQNRDDLPPYASF